MLKTNERPTIYDVARRASVSANTVSRALNGKPNVAEATRLRIVQAAEELQYHPHLGARSLRTEQEGSVGLIFPAPPNIIPVGRNFFLDMCSELYRIFGTQGDRIAIDLNPYADGKNRDYARSVWEKRCSVAFFAGPMASDDSIIARVHHSGIPYLTLGRLDSLPECSCATVDYEQATYDSVACLVSRGHRRIGLLQGLPGFQPGVERERGYLRALEAFDIAPEKRLIQPVSFDASEVARATYRLLNDPGVTALVEASGAENATAIRDSARRAGRRVGKDFDIVCWTYSLQHALLNEAVAHLWLPVREAASEGLELLAEWHRGERSEPIRLVYQPTLTETSALDPEPSEEVARATHLFDGNRL